MLAALLHAARHLGNAAPATITHFPRHIDCSFSAQSGQGPKMDAGEFRTGREDRRQTTEEAAGWASPPYQNH